MACHKNLQLEFDSIIEGWRHLTDEEGFTSFKDLFITMKWDDCFPSLRETFRPGKSMKRPLKYIIPSEVERFKELVHTRSSTSIKFGLHKERGDFCLVGGCYRKSGKTFYVFYRAIELTLEFPFDIIMLDSFFKEVGIEVKKISIFAADGFTSTRAGRLKYFEKLKELTKDMPESKEKDKVYYLHHFESKCVFTETNRRKVRKALKGEGNLCEIDKKTYEKLKAKYEQ